MSLKKLTDSIHKEAEQTKWSKLLVSGNMAAHQYGQYLYNQLQIYSALESRAHNLGLFQKYPMLNNIKRSAVMGLDLQFFPYKTGLEECTLKYIDYCEDLNADQVLAHIYVRHFGDMYGGQIVSKKVPTPLEESILSWTNDKGETPWGDEQGWVEMYKFNDRAETIKYIRSILDIRMADEAIYCFQRAIQLFHSLEKRFDL
tara:strand:+ start:306 stop:908 length:603 start_codon:yes stop_codon:yes gene_type:complete